MSSSIILIALSDHDLTVSRFELLTFLRRKKKEEDRQVQEGNLRH